MIFNFFFFNGGGVLLLQPCSAGELRYFLMTYFLNYYSCRYNVESLIRDEEHVFFSTKNPTDVDVTDLSQVSDASCYRAIFTQCLQITRSIWNRK